MSASFLSGLRWTITQLVTQKHELGKDQEWRAIMLNFNEQMPLQQDSNLRKQSLAEAFVEFEKEDHREQRQYVHVHHHDDVERTDKKLNYEENCNEMIEQFVDGRSMWADAMFDAKVFHVAVETDRVRDHRTDVDIFLTLSHLEDVRRRSTLFSDPFPLHDNKPDSNAMR